MNLVQYIESIHREQIIKEASPDLDAILEKMDRGTLEKIASGKLSLDQALDKTAEDDGPSIEKRDNPRQNAMPKENGNLKNQEKEKESSAKFVMFDKIARIMAKNAVVKTAASHKHASACSEMEKIDEFISPEAHTKAKIVQNAMKMCRNENEKKASIQAAGMALALVNLHSSMM